MKTIGLAMIVKDEAETIIGCLDSVASLVDKAVIIDTGSTDDTQAIVRARWPDAVIVQMPWVDFATNRSAALARLRVEPGIDYAFMIDADDRLAFDPDFDPASFKAGLDKDLYDIRIEHDGMRDLRPHLFRNDLSFRYRGIVHEYLEAPPDVTRDIARGLRMVTGTGGAWRRAGNVFLRDAAMLVEALKTETDTDMRRRYAFYLAQSYRDAGDREAAREAYLRRASMGGWTEEIYVSLIEAGHLSNDPLECWKMAIRCVPARGEAYHALARWFRVAGKWDNGRFFSYRGLERTEPERALFSQPWVYEYGMLDEYAVNAYHAGDYHDSLDACMRLLTEGKLPASEAERVAKNARFAWEKMK